MYSPMETGFTEKGKLDISLGKEAPLPTCSPVTAEKLSNCSPSPLSTSSSWVAENRETYLDGDPLHFPAPHGWDFRSYRNARSMAAIQMVGGSGRGPELQYENDVILRLKGFDQMFQVKTVRPLSREGGKMKGWQRPGPGPRIGRKRVAALNSLEQPFMFALLHLAKEAVHVQQMYECSPPADMASNACSIAEHIAQLTELDEKTTVSQAMKKKIWSLAPQLGVPGFIIKLSSTPHALAMYMVPGTEGNHWWCTVCITAEVQAVPNCEHGSILRECLQRISSYMRCTMDYVIDMLIRSAAYHHTPELTTASFYGKPDTLEFAVVRSGLNPLSAPIDRNGRIQIVRRLRKTSKWTCVSLSCSGVASETNEACIHAITVRAHIDEGLTAPFSSLFDVGGRSFHTSFPDEGEDIPIPRHIRPMIPSERALRVDEEVNRDAHNNSTTVIPAARYCHCGCYIEENASSGTVKIPIRVEAARCHANYLQEVWTCRNGHRVLPEEDSEAREGLVWISKDTAFTEVFMFDMLLQMVLGGATIGSQADIRSQIMYLQTEYTNREDAPRSRQTVRKALTIYAMSVVRGLEDWVFRCAKCASRRSDGVYYDKIAFDGQQVGFKIRNDIRYDFYGKKAAAWRRKIERCPTAWQTAHLIESHVMRTIITETLRVRQVPAGCNSVHSLCRVMMSFSMHTKESVRAAVAALKLLDQEWTSYLPSSVASVDDRTLQNFEITNNPELSSHPFHFIMRTMTEGNFSRGKRIMDVFRYMIDGRKAAGVLAVLLTHLREDLKQYIPTHDVTFLDSYSLASYDMLSEWLVQMSQRESWALIQPQQFIGHLEQSTNLGIAEHARNLKHPYRSPWSWTPRATAAQRPSQPQFHRSDNMVSGVRDVGDWRCPEEAVTRILLMLMSVLNEPVSVWLRDGKFDEFSSAVEILSSAELFCGQSSISDHCRVALLKLEGCVLMYEGIMGIIGANHPAARIMFSVLRDLLLCVPEKYECYRLVMRNSEASNSFMFSPKQFDDMLVWTGAVPVRDEGDRDTTMGAFIRAKYERISSCQSDDFLETGVWAPDFPIRRPSPATNVWGRENSRVEKACSKKYDVHTSFSPGTFGGYCLCKHAKTVLIMFLKQPEGCRMPLNFIIERCLELPRYMVYDFACGTQKAALGISSEIVQHTSFVIDPFHFSGHKTCSLAMHQSSYSDIRGHNTESQEQRNIGIRMMERTLRASRDTHFMHFVILAHGYLNLKAMFKDRNEAEPTEWGQRAWIRWVRDNLFGAQENER